MMQETILSQVGYCKICESSFDPGDSEDAERLVSVGICETCDFWMYHFNHRNNPEVAIANGHHYMIGQETDYPKGMDGVGVKISFFDGREVITDSLWSQGHIPAVWQPWLYDNATIEFIKQIK